MSDVGHLSIGAGGQAAWGLQSLAVALGGTPTQGTNKVGRPSVAGRDLVQGGNVNFCFSPKSFINRYLESRRHLLTETYVVVVRLEG